MDSATKAMEGTGGICLNPPRDIQFSLNDSTELVVLTTYLESGKKNESECKIEFSFVQMQIVKSAVGI